MPLPESWSPDLAQYATPGQVRNLAAVIQHGSIRGAARELGVAYSGVYRSLEALKKRAAMKGFAPECDMTRTVPDPFVVKGVSTYYDADGKPRGQWVKSALSAERVDAAVRAAVEALSEEVPRARKRRAPAATRDELAVLYTLTDCHVGMLAWGKETGADWDLKIAEHTLVGAFSYLVDASPPARVGIVAELGDFLHFDSLQAVTPTHQHVLDADGRFSRVVAAGVRVLRAVIDRALSRHEQVIVLLAEGNHDLASSVWLRHLFGLLYEREPRVSVIDSELPYYIYRHGETLLAWHHGHLAKGEALPAIIAAQYPQDWGATRYRYAHTGHRHHAAEREFPGMHVIQHPTIAARDSYAARGGYIADRSITAICYHATQGQASRHTVRPEMIGGGSDV